MPENTFEENLRLAFPEKSRHKFLVRLPKVIINVLWISAIILLIVSIVLLVKRQWLRGSMCLVFVPSNLVLAKFLFSKVCPVEIPTLSVGILTVWGKRVAILLLEGKHLLWPKFPFFVNVEIVSVKGVSMTEVYKDIRAKATRDDDDGAVTAGGEVEIEVSLNLHPDWSSPIRLLMHMQKGGLEVVKSMLKDIVSEGLREKCGDMDWETMNFDKIEIKKTLLFILTAETNWGEGSSAQKLTHGIADRLDFGLVFTGINVGRIREEETLAAASNQVAVEAKEREAEKIQMAHHVDLREMLRESGEKDSKEVTKIILTESGKADTSFISFDGLNPHDGSVGLIGPGLFAGREPRSRKIVKKPEDDKKTKEKDGVKSILTPANESTYEQRLAEIEELKRQSRGKNGGDSYSRDDEDKSEEEQ